MNPDLTEEEMRQALFGTAQPELQLAAPTAQEPLPEIVFTKPLSVPTAKKKFAKSVTSRLRVTLRVGNEFEGKTFELIHEADTLSTLLAEQEAVKAAKKSTSTWKLRRSFPCSHNFGMKHKCGHIEPLEMLVGTTITTNLISIGSCTTGIS